MAAPRAGITAWSGRGVAKARAFMNTNTQWPVICARCNKPVQQLPATGWAVGHIKARGTHPELTWVQSNWRIEHRKCSNASGQEGVIEKAKADARRVDFSPNQGHAETPPLPVSLSPEVQETMITRQDLAWDPEYLSRFEWLQPLLDIPEDARPPLMMTPVPGDAIGTYGWEAVEWIEAQLNLTLRWWQRLSLVRQLEHRANGSLCFRTKVESAPRRAGKSVGLRGHALWRMERGQELFGEVQTLIHSGSDLAICREIQRGAWRWSESHGWTVTRGNGKEAIESGSGSRWMTRAQDAVYGYDVTVGMVDESWNVKPDTVSEGLEPGMLERSNPQLIMTSTAHRRATSLMRTYLTDAMTTNDPTVLLLLWAAPMGSNPGDPEVWRDASPHWSEDRRAMIAAKYEKALAGQDDPEFDDPDPMAGFEAQYLNIWKVHETRTVGNPVISADSWTLLATTTQPGVPDSIAVEAWFGEGVAVARAWKPLEGPVVVSVDNFPDLPAAAAYVAALGIRKPVLVGASLAENSTWKQHKVRVKAVSSATRAGSGGPHPLPFGEQVPARRLRRPHHAGAGAPDQPRSGRPDGSGRPSVGTR